jgi:capsular exopolysaccharide synthesis family protein
LDPIEFLRAVRRRWVVVVAAVGVALVAGWLTTRVAPTGPPVKTYRATSILLSTSSSPYAAPGVTSLQTLAALTTVGDVPKQVVQVLAREEDPVELAQLVRATANPQTGILKISATSTDPNEAKLLADTFATELVAFLGSRETLTTAREADSIQRRLERLREEISELDQQIAGASEGETAVLTAERDAKVNQYSLLYQQFSQLATASDQTGALQIIQDAVPLPVATSTFIQVRSLPSRLVLAGIFGLLAGAGVVFVLERFDTRIRNKRRAEESFELPVLAEIPEIPRRKIQQDGIVTASRPKSMSADAFRILGAAVMRRPPQVPQVILVTSPGPGEGKTTVVANLAATFGEVGKKVLVISCDLHRPAIHRRLGVPNSKGLTEMLRGMQSLDENGQGRSREALILDGNVWKTRLENVRVIPSGPVPEKPAELLSSEAMRELLAKSREVADVVLIDTAPILAVSDATHLFPLVDAILVVGAAGRTTVEAASRANELLLRLGAPALGVALNRVTETALPRGYYAYYQPASEGRRARRGTAPEPSRRSGFTG